jgi:hypothetical protein
MAQIAANVKPNRPKTSDYFAELYVAGRFADAGWNVYFPRRDRGFDFIASRIGIDGMELIRPVQVKGKYPEDGTGDRRTYGYIGELTGLHPDMVLAIPFFTFASRENPTCVAYLPFGLIRTHSRGYRCEPATFCDATPRSRRDYAKFFGDPGLHLVERIDWSSLTIGR